MKQGHRRMLGLGLMMHLFGMGAMGVTPKEATGKEIGVSHFNSNENPIFSGKSQKRKKHNRLNISHKTRLKHRRAA